MFLLGMHIDFDYSALKVEVSMTPLFLISPHPLQFQQSAEAYIISNFHIIKICSSTNYCLSATFPEEFCVLGGYLAC